MTLTLYSLLNLLGNFRVLILFVLFFQQAAANEDQGDFFLVFVGPYRGSPASIFGHIFLFHSDDYKTFNLSKAYGLNAIVSPDVSMMDYIVKGLSGGFRAKIISDTFYKFTLKYKGIEDRDMYIFQFKKNIPNSLFQKIISKYEMEYVPYYFAEHNCTTFIREAVNTIHDLGKNREDYPYLLIRDLLDNNLITLVEYRNSRLNNLNNSYANLTYNNRKRVKKIIDKIQSNDYHHGNEEITEPEKKFFSSYYDYQSGNLEKLNTLKKYLSIPSSTLPSPSEKIDLEEMSSVFSQAHSPRLLELGFLMNGKKKISYRHSLHNQKEGGFLPNYYDSFNLVRLETEIDDGKMKVTEVNLLDFLSVSDFNFLTKRPSYSFSIFHENYHIKSLTRKASGMSFGTGISTISTRFQFSILAITFIEQHKNRVDPGLGGQSFFTYPINFDFHINGGLEYKRRKSMEWIEGSVRGVYKIMRDFSTTIETKINRFERSEEITHKLAFNFYF